MQLPLYQYRPLDGGHIRILEFQPNGTSQLRNIDVMGLSASVKYVALSYTWGASTETFPFECDTQNLPVRENLLQALSRLRHVIDSPIWIDAMCINQDHELEKMGQIQMMADIYKRAEKVLIWLGEEIPETKDTVGRIRDITTALKAKKDTTHRADLTISPSFMKGVRHLMTCPWWPRLWVLQEATLAREEAFVCGPHVIPWKMLSSLVKQIKRLDLYALFRGHDQSLEFCDGFTEILNVEIVQHLHSTTLATDLIRICRQRMCFDPCDRVYGVIGLMDSYVRKGLTWEPGEKVENLYPPFVGVLLQLDTTAMLLSLTETTQRNPNLPSWCPDLHQRSVANVLADHEGYHAGFSIQTTTKFDWDQYQRDPNKLRTKAIVVDTVKSINDEEWMGDNNNDHTNEQTQLTVQRLNTALLQIYTKVAEKFLQDEDLWRLFIGNQIGNEDSKLHWLAGFSSIHDRLTSRRWKNEAETYRTSFHKLRAWTSDAGEPIPTYLEKARRVCLGRKLFTTKGGRIGFGPKTMAVGDVLCIIKGAKVPFILKQHDALPNTYYLKGEAYVHGLMQGEYLKVNKSFYWLSIV